VDLFANLALGLETAFSASALLYCTLGVTLGTFIGVLPGIGPLATVGMLLPLTFYAPPTEALIMLAGIYYGSMYGGSTASILLNLPGTAGAAVTCLDGYPLAQQGRAGLALFMTTLASFVGSVSGIVVLAGFAPLLARVALNFNSPEYFSLMVLGLLMAALVGEGSQFRALAMVVLGLLLGIVGIDVTSGTPRFTFGVWELREGVNLVVITTGLFGVAEVMTNAGRISGQTADPKAITWRSMVPTRADMRLAWPAALRGTGVGAIIGALPGTGAALATFVSYALEKRIAKDPSRFGRGALEGVVGPEAANNSAAQTAFVPTLSLGIPGDAIVAIMLGALIIHGVVPGPRLIIDNPSLFWGLTMSFLIGNVILVILNLPLIGLWIRILLIPYRLLYPAVIVFIAIGVFSLNNSVFDVTMVMVFGIVGYGMRLLKFSPAPLLLGLVLGPLMEQNLRRSLLISRGDMSVFIERPISAACLGLALALIVVIVGSGLWRRRRAGLAAARAEPE
jgi:putative tricarboxylic transport membrane protein